MEVTKEANQLISDIWNKTSIKDRTKGGNVYLRIGMIEDKDRKDFVLGYEDEIGKDDVVEDRGIKCIFDAKFKDEFAKLKVDAYCSVINGETQRGLSLILEES